MRVLLFSIVGMITVFGNALNAEEPSANLYRKHCASCHGADGKGTSVLRKQMGANVIDLTSIEQAIKLTDTDLHSLIKNGRSALGMPAFKGVLNQQQITDIIVYVDGTILPQLQDIRHLRKGQKIYQRHCSVCHGDRGQVAMWAKAGLDPSPADFSNHEKRADLKRQRMLFSVSNGRPETAMTSWLGRFEAVQIEAVVDYIRVALMQAGRYDQELGFNKGVGAPKNDPFMSATNFGSESALTNNAVAKNEAAKSSTSQTTKRAPDPFLDNPDYTAVTNQDTQDDIYDALNGTHDHEAHMGPGSLDTPLPGNFVVEKGRGKQLYQDNCSACHGTKGDGKGPRAFFIFPKPRNFHHPAVVNKFNRPHIFTQVSKGIEGTVMPAWKQVLSKQEIADITEYLFVDIIHAGKPPVKPKKR